MNCDKPTTAAISDVDKKMDRNCSTTKLLLGVAALALGQALQDGNGFLTAGAIAWLTVALICVGASAASQYMEFPPVSNKILWGALTIGLIWQIIQLLTVLPGIYISHDYLPKIWQFQVCIVSAGICALLSLAPIARLHSLAQRGLIISVFIAILAAGVWVIRSSPEPAIDTFMFQQTSSEALLQGHNPYELTNDNVYRDLSFYGTALVREGKLTFGNPYPPLSIYLSLLGYAFGGDIRYSHLMAILAAGVLMTLLRPGRGTLLAAYIFLFTPRAFFVLEQSWTEPLVLLFSVAVVWCAIHRPGWIFVAFGLLIASKQYMILLLPLTALLIPAASPRRVWAQAAGQIGGVALVVTAPLAFWNFTAFVWNVGLIQFYQVFREDALSYAAVYALLTGHAPSHLIPFILLCVVLLLAWRYGTHSPAGFATALALGLGLFFAFNKQAFCNYYFLVVGLICCALAAIPQATPSQPSSA